MSSPEKTRPSRREFHRAAATARKFRLGVVDGAWEKPEPEVESAFREALGVLGKFAVIEEIRLPDLPFGATAGTLITAEAASAFEDLIESGRAAGEGEGGEPDPRRGEGLPVPHRMAQREAPGRESEMREHGANAAPRRQERPAYFSSPP